MPSSKPLTVDFGKEKEAAYQRIYSRSPQLTSLKAGWRGVYFGCDYMPPGETPEVIAKQHCIATFTNVVDTGKAERSIGGIQRQEQVADGDILIVPANVGCRSRWEAASNVMFFGIDPAIFAHAIHEAVDPDRIELLPHFATPDPLVHQMGQSLKTALETFGSMSRLYGETMISALSVHLTQHYCAQRPHLRDYADGLPNHRLQQVRDYIAAHLDRDLSLLELANLAQMSCHYFSQLFKRSTGLSPHQYVIRARVERAKALLMQGDLSIAEVAKAVGFVDQSHLHRHVKQLTGVTPKVLQQFKK